MSYELTDFQEEIIDASMTAPVVVDFWAPWCGPCRALGPVLEKMAATAEGRWQLVKVNVDENQALAHSFQVQSIPAVYLVDKGKIVDGFAGALPEAQIKAWLEPHLTKAAPQPPPKGGLATVEAALAAGMEEQAIALLRQLMAEDPSKEEIRLKLAHTLVFSAPAEAISLLAAIEATSKLHDRAGKLTMLCQGLLDDVAALPEHAARAYQAAAYKALADKQFEEALDQFLEVLYRDKEYHDGAARKGIIGLFEYLGRDHAITKAYQRRFEMAMF